MGRHHLSYTFNLLVWVLGFILYGIGVWLRWKGSGVFVAVIVLMGSYAVFRREGNVLLVYCVLVTIVFLFMAVTGFYNFHQHQLMLYITICIVTTLVGS